MKRKKKKIFRPLIDIPKGHPAREKWESLHNDTEWKRTDIPGVWWKSILDHRTCIAYLQQFWPELLKMNHHPINASYYCASFINPNQHQGYTEAIILGMFFPPDADDPERLESGWALQIMVGPSEAKQQMRERGEFTMRQAAGKDAVTINRPAP